jgi:hypothetical protein
MLLRGLHALLPTTGTKFITKYHILLTPLTKDARTPLVRTRYAHSNSSSLRVEL